MKITFQNYKEDKYYPRIVRAVREILTDLDGDGQGEIIMPGSDGVVRVWKAISN